MTVAGKGEPGGTGDVTLLAHITALLAEHRKLVERIREADDLRYQQRFDAQREALEYARVAAEKAVASALAAAEKAVVKAETASDRRFESMNEFRGQLDDQASRFMTRAEHDAGYRALVDKVTDLTSRFDKTEGNKQGAIDMRTVIIALVFLTVAVAGVLGLR